MHIKFQDYEEAAKVVQKKVDEYCTAYLEVSEKTGLKSAHHNTKIFKYV